MTSKLSDDLVARVAGRMTDADPSPRLRTRVLAAIDQTPSPRRVWWVPVFATAVVAVTIVSLWPHPQAPALPALPSLAALSAPATLDVPSLTNEATTQSAPRAGVDRARRMNVVATPSADELEFRARAIPALDRVSPIALESIQPQPLSIPLLVISPLSSTANTAGGDVGK